MRILVTGANRGIGAALCEELVNRGEEVLPTARHADGMLSLDVTDTASLRDFRRRMGEDSLDALVCNAGIYPDKGQRLDDGYPPEMWAEAFATNVTGVFLTVQTLLPNLRRGTAPRIAIIGSQMGSTERAPGGSYIYRATKAAVLNLGRNLAADLRPEGIAVGIYHPGWVQTAMGGRTAEIDTHQSAAGLADRLAALSVATTGRFETWDGRAHPF
ncbi:SDR family NAD(P)-dependent oxidoreductase [Roseivivax isoporae]|uniref:Short-chain dehydrogenase n=1 Tax=Roseivivax isoporae LMG 25204 TaxID=1449351 RepID=X7F2X4_9RHOB|nr:SDR family NAD(P)-dependent oxidoreductase [Roseivivax isoporae]ETX27140.1 short-chain dehydrogenase [Roseivivax isoporae LMG 25204]